jgi:hypothetical protein
MKHVARDLWQYLVHSSAQAEVFRTILRILMALTLHVRKTSTICSTG